MDCMETIKSRRSIRQYLDEPVPREVVMEILAAGQLAPSAGNLQPCYFIVVSDQEQRRQMLDAALGQELIGQAPLIIVVCVEPERSAQYGDIGRNYLCLLDAANATQNMLLAARSFGYGSCWVGGFSEKRVKKALDLPPEFRVVSLIPVGKAAETPEQPPRRPLEEVVRWDRWQD